MFCTLFGSQTGPLVDAETLHPQQGRGCTQICASGRGCRAQPGSNRPETPGPHLPAEVMLVIPDREMWQNHTVPLASGLCPSI